MKKRFQIFACSGTTDLAVKISEKIKLELGQYELKKFSDGEFFVQFKESVRGSHVFLIQSTHQPTDNLMELLLMIDAAKRASAKSITAVIPYFGFARQDRKDKPRVPITAKLIANLLQTAGATRIITMDLHADQIQGFFDIPVDHLMASAIFVPYIKKMNITDLVFVAPDSGAAKRVRKYSDHFNVDMILCDKIRRETNEVDKITVIGDVIGKNVIILDDLVDTANTLCKVAEALISKGAKSVRALCVHPVLSGNAYEKIESSSLLEMVITDTVPLKHESPKIKVISVDELFAIAIKNVHSNGSVTKLFIL
jgi:ribose-phosphate pyrophosphokinase